MAHPVDPLTELPHDERIRSRKLVGGIATIIADATGLSELERKALEEQLAAKLAGAEKTIASTRAAAMSNVRGIAADAAGQIVQQLTGVVPDAASVNAAVDASLKG